MSAIFHYVNGAIAPQEKAMISALDLGLLRGYGVFDYVPVFSGRPFHLRQHLRRLEGAAERVDLPLPLSLEQMEEISWELLEKNPVVDAGLRFLVTGGLSSKDQLLPTQESSLVILFHPSTPYPDNYYQLGVCVVTTPLLRLLPSIKTTNYMPAIFAIKKAKAAGAEDALYLDHEGRVIEGTTSNVFFVKDEALMTNDSDEMVKGITREVVLTLAKKHYPIVYRALSIEEAVACDEAFLTSSTKGVMPLVQIEGRKIGEGVPGPLSSHLRSLYEAYVEEYFERGAHLLQKQPL